MTSRIRSYRPEHHGTLKDAMVELVEAAGGLRAAADICRLNKTRLGEICSPHRDDVHAPIDVVQALEMATGCRAVTHHLAARHGALLVEMGFTETAVVLNDLRGGVLRSNADAVKAAADSISNQMAAAADQLRQLIERVERLEEEKAAMAADIREVYAEAKANGFEPKIMRQVIRLRKMDRDARAEQEAVLSLYLEALGEARPLPLLNDAAEPKRAA